MKNKLISQENQMCFKDVRSTRSPDRVLAKGIVSPDNSMERMKFLKV